ncbi:MAG TPA: hypothetical protein VMF61_01605 [Candidatus Acidoferrales bacterium]|nr:hypothetical protein [Candidatus Acidoferrales bacterium]
MNLRAARSLSLSVTLLAAACAPGGSPGQGASLAPSLVRPAVAGGLVVSEGDTGYHVVSSVKGANVHFDALPKSGCEIKRDCYVFAASTGLVGIPIEAPPKCHVDQGNSLTPSVAQCPEVGGVVFHMNGGGTWSAYDGGGGEHVDGPCASGHVTVYTGGARTGTSVDSWDGCHETVVCVKAKASFAGVEADAFDVVDGKCGSIVRH